MRLAPLADMRIIAIEQYGAGPFGSLHLSDLGAEVIKIEDPRSGGDVGRYVPPFTEGEDSLFFQTFNRGKRSISLDLSTEAGYEVLLDLVGHADAVYSNLRGDLPERLRITYGHLSEVNPAIVCVSLSGFGMTGPRQAEPAYDYILQGLAGWMSLTGAPDGPPTKTGLSLVDYLGGVMAGFSLVAAVHAARRDGIGSDCDISLYDVAMSMLTYPAAWLANEGYEVERTEDSAHPSLVPFQNFRTADGWIVVGCAKEKFWRRLTQAIGMPELADTMAYRDFSARREHRETLVAKLSDVFAGASTEEWLIRLSEAGVPSGPVNDLGQALKEPHAAARQVMVTVDHPHRGDTILPSTAVRVGDHRPVAAPAPERNADADSVFGDLLGYDSDHRARLAAGGAFGEASTR